MDLYQNKEKKKLLNKSFNNLSKSFVLLKNKLNVINNNNKFHNNSVEKLLHSNSNSILNLSKSINKNYVNSNLINNSFNKFNYNNPEKNCTENVFNTFNPSKKQFKNSNSTINNYNVNKEKNLSKELDCNKSYLNCQILTENKYLKFRIEELNKSKLKLVLKINKMNNELEKYKSKLKEEKQNNIRLIKSNSILDNIKSENISLNNLINNLSFDNNNLSSFNLDLSNKNKEKDKIITEFKDIVVETEAKLKELDIKFEELQTNNINITKELSELNNELIIKNNEIKALNDKLIICNNEIINKSSQINILITNHKEELQKAIELNNIEFKSNYDIKEQNLRSLLSKELIDLKSENEELIIENKAYKSQIEKNNIHKIKEKENLQNNINNLNTQIFNLKETNKTLEQQKLELLKTIDNKNLLYINIEKEYKKLIEDFDLFYRKNKYSVYNMLENKNNLSSLETRIYNLMSVKKPCNNYKLISNTFNNLKIESSVYFDILKCKNVNYMYIEKFKKLENIKVDLETELVKEINKNSNYEIKINKLLFDINNLKCLKSNINNIENCNKCNLLLNSNKQINEKLRIIKSNLITIIQKFISYNNGNKYYSCSENITIKENNENITDILIKDLNNIIHYFN